jgi:hypothetical protein
MGLIDISYENSEMGLLMAFITALRDRGRSVGMHIDGSVTVDGETRTSEEFKRLARQWNGNDDTIDELFPKS